MIAANQIAVRRAPVTGSVEFIDETAVARA
jgi:hypothetical protein